MKRAGIVAALLVLLMTALGSKAGLIALPDVPARAAPGGFDTARALARLKRILGDQQPHGLFHAPSLRPRAVMPYRAKGATASAG